MEPEQNPEPERAESPEPTSLSLIQQLRRVIRVMAVMSFEPFSSIVGSVTADLVAEIRNRQKDFDSKVTEAVKSLRNTSTLISELQTGVEERVIKLEHLRQEHDRYSQLAQIDARKAEALLKEVEKTLGRERRTERWVALAMHLGFGILFFVLGVVLSDPLKNWFSQLWARVFH